MIPSLLARTRLWISEKLSRRLALALAGSLILASAAFLVLLIGAYRNRVTEERSFASLQLNSLLQIGLENAMLKRDIDGLRHMIERLGKQERIVRVLILAPDGEVRFSSEEALLGRRFDLKAGALCPDCSNAPAADTVFSRYISTAETGDVLRSINPVRNQEPCTQCHGKIDANPINGILVVDYDAARIKGDTLYAIVTLSTAGIVVGLTAIGGIGWMLRRSVVDPLTQLTQAASRISTGDLTTRVADVGGDELGQLGRAFNEMSVRVEQSMSALEDRERRLQAIIDAVPDGIRVLSPDFRVLRTNAAFCRQQGLTRDEVLSQPCYRSSHRRDTPCPATLVTCPLTELRDSMEPLTCRHRHIDASGRELHVEVSAAAFLIETNKAPERVVVEVIRDLRQDVRLSHEHRLSELGFLAAGVAHEIHNPLASIHLGLASISRSISSKRFDEAETYVRVIDEQIERCIEVTSRLLRLSAGRTDHPELVALDSVVSDILSLLQAEADGAGVALSFTFDGDLRVIAADGDMRMLVLNVAQNALHAMPQGGTFSITGRLEHGTCTLEFADTGVGIPADDLGRIFDPFWTRRADSVRGTGLGLAICKQIVSHWRGTISVRSKLGVGTTFYVTFPSADAALEGQ